MTKKMPYMPVADPRMNQMKKEKMYKKISEKVMNA